VNLFRAYNVNDNPPNTLNNLIIQYHSLHLCDIQASYDYNTNDV